MESSANLLNAARGLMMATALIWALIVALSTARPFDDHWLFHRRDSAPNCSFTDLGVTRCLGLTQVASASTPELCQQACCGEPVCETWQFCPANAECPEKGCWIGAQQNCGPPTTGWISKARSSPSECDSTFASFDDSDWRELDVSMTGE